MAATVAPPPSSPSSTPPAPRAGPAVAAVNMPVPPSIDSSPKGPSEPTYDLQTQLEKFAKPLEDGLVHKNNTPKQPDPPKQPDEKPQPDPIEDPGEPTEDDPKTPVPVEAKADEKPVEGEKKKVNPWKLAKQHEESWKKAEAEKAELRKLIKDEATAKAESERLTKAEARAKELEDHLRFIDYQNHPEFKEKYQKPYDDSFNRLMKRLSGVGVTDADGTKRAVSVKDVLELGSLPADAVIEQAEAKFGKLGTWVAERIEDLKQLSESRIEALDRAKKEGGEKAQREAQDFQIKQKELNEFLKTTWTKSTEEIETHSKYGKYFRPIEGDEEYNTRITKGKELVDKALSETPTDPSLTPQQREAIIKRHAAMRQRAIAFGTQQLTIERLEAKLNEATEKLKQYEASEPTITGRQANGNGSTPVNEDPWARFSAALEAKARPALG